MKYNETELDQLIDQLNNNPDVASLKSDNLEGFELTDAEYHFVKTFKPEKHLIIYGTLAPGQSNHSQVEHIRGCWRKGVVKGKLEKTGWGAEFGYYAFRHVRGTGCYEIPAHILTSEELIMNWSNLDDFEGDGYKRILAKYEIDDGELGVGFIYAAND